MKGPETHRVTYVNVAVRVRCPHVCDDVMSIEWGDVGEPGPWGDTWVEDGDDGYWLFDPYAQAAAYAHLRNLISNTRF